MSREPNSQKSGWINHSNKRIFQVMTFKKSIHSVVLHVNANFAQSLIGDWDSIAVADLKGVQGVPRY